MKKMKFAEEDLFLRYCIIKAFRPFASKKEKAQLSKELKLVNERKRLLK